MKAFASKEKQSVTAGRKARPYVHYPMGPVQRAQQAEIHSILRSSGTQAKLTIGQPDDKYEQEADRVADQVMRMPDPKLQRQPENEEEEDTLQAKPLADQITPLVQRQEEPGEGEEEEPVQASFKDGAILQRMYPECEKETAQRQPMEEEEEELQAKSKSGEAPEVTAATSSGIQSLRGGGRPMSGLERSFFEPRFGADFSAVRMHNGAGAASAAQSISARAFTLGRNVVFGTGEYSPDSSSGRKLFAHELAHVVQQNGGGHVRQKRVLPPLLARFSQRVVQKRGIAEEYKKTKRWKHLEGGSYRKASAAELENDTFLKLHPKSIPKNKGMPNLGRRTYIKFFIDSRKRNFKKPTAISAWLGRRYEKMVMGPEVNKLYEWQNKQVNVALMIYVANETLMTLQKNHILDKNFNIRHKTKLRSMLTRLAVTGRTDSYASNRKDRSAKILKAAGKITQRDVELKKHFIETKKYQTEVQSLYDSVTIAKNDLQTFYREQEKLASKAALAAINKEKAETMKNIGLVIDLSTSTLGVMKGIADLRSDATDEGRITATSSALGVVKVVSTLVVDAKYAKKIKNAKSALKIARIRAVNSKKIGLVKQIDSLVSRFNSYTTLSKRINRLTGSYFQMKQASAGAFGTIAAEALGEMKGNRRLSRRDPFSARTRKSKGNIQRVFANVLEYEVLSVLHKAPWPELEGEIPLSGWMRTNRGTRVYLKYMAREAAKLRWWKKQMNNINKLFTAIKKAIFDIGNKTKSL